MDRDDSIREEYAVGISVRTSDSGKLLLIFDDLKLRKDGPPLVWKQWAFFTYLEVDEGPFEEGGELSESQLKAIGTAVAVRLSALRSLGR